MDYIKTQKQFFCQVCHARFDKGPGAIAQHEKTQKHKRAKEKQLRDQVRKAKNEVTPEDIYKREVESLDARNRGRYSGNMPEKPKKPHGESGGMSFPNKINKWQKEEQPRAPVMDNNPYFDPRDLSNVWKLMVDEDTGDVFFYNTISGNRQTEKPIGVRLSEYEQELYEKSLKRELQTFTVQQNQDHGLTNLAMPGQWEAVEPEEDYYKQNAAEEQDIDAVHYKELRINEDEDEDEDELEDVDIGDLQNEEGLTLEDIKNIKAQKLLNDKDKLAEILDIDRPEIGKSALRSKTDKLKKIVENNLEEVAKPIFRKVPIEREHEDDSEYTEKEKATKEDEKLPGNMLFKKRKFNKNQKALVELAHDSD